MQILSMQMNITGTTSSSGQPELMGKHGHGQRNISGDDVGRANLVREEQEGYERRQSYERCHANSPPEIAASESRADLALKKGKERADNAEIMQQMESKEQQEDADAPREAAQTATRADLGRESDVIAAVCRENFNARVINYEFSLIWLTVLIHLSIILAASECCKMCWTT